MKQQIINEFDNKKILILGFGREGQSTYSFIQKNVTYAHLGIADKRDIFSQIEIPKNVTLHTGENYMDCIFDYDIIIKTPGISLKDIDVSKIKDKITSQTDLFIKYGRNKIIGVTGTKGKSTTSSLIYYILFNAEKVVKLIGNIGVPAFESLDEEKEVEYFVYELSAHQLEYLHESPHIAVILNFFEEHLDHFETIEKYQNAKLNIFKYQEDGDFAIYGSTINRKLPETKALKIEVGEEIERGKNITAKNGTKLFSNVNDNEMMINFPKTSKLMGKHNIYNSMIAITVANILKICEDIVKNSIKTFKTLPHRLQYVGKYNNIEYVDDSISTIPEATIAAIETLNNVGSVLIGGMDRGIDYEILVKYINSHNQITFILMYESGKRIYDSIDHSQNIIYVEDLQEAVAVAKKQTKKGSICLLSPAAASFGHFKNFEERGEKFKQYIINK